GFSNPQKYLHYLGTHRSGTLRRPHGGSRRTFAAASGQRRLLARELRYFLGRGGQVDRGQRCNSGCVGEAAAVLSRSVPVRKRYCCAQDTGGVPQSLRRISKAVGSPGFRHGRESEGGQLRARLRYCATEGESVGSRAEGGPVSAVGDASYKKMIERTAGR